MDNGGLFVPEGFGVIVVSDGVGPSRHLAVKNNGDIYVKLRKANGRNGNVALRDNDGDGKADIIERFGDYPNDGKFGTEMKINDGYLYYTSELVIYRQLLDPYELIPKGKPEIILHGKAKELANELNINNIHVSLSHEEDKAIAYTISEIEK